MSAESKGGAARPSPLRALFARLRRQPKPALAEPAGKPAPVLPPPVLPPTAPPPSAPVDGPPPGADARPAPSRQISLLAPAANKRGDRTIFIADFVEQFKQLMRRMGVARSDPITPLMNMLCEMLIHYSHISQDLSDDLHQAMTDLDRRFGAATADLRVAMTEAGRAVERSARLASERMEAIAAQTVQHRAEVLQKFSTEAENVIRTAVVDHVRVRTWRDKLIVTAITAAVGGGGYLLGQTNEHAEMMTAIQAGTAKFNAILLRDGVQVGLHWMDLMEWNNLDDVSRNCTTHPSGGDDRRACQYTFWEDAPPEDAPPPPP